MSQIKVGSVVFHTRLKKGPGTVISFDPDDSTIVEVFWQRSLEKLPHPVSSLTLS